MKTNVSALALAAGLLWGAAIFMLALANLVWPGYGRAFLDVVGSVYPGYHPGTGFGSVISGTLYALLDGAVAGAIIGWLYNRLAHRHSAA
ncbi:MAG TPA: hypothetical protein VFX92_12745 [Candidatus Krumholzibacteria bacterium]|nr:hypothetical protein [Candidatus Krumholzibacteria bacterium]